MLITAQLSVMRLALLGVGLAELVDGLLAPEIRDDLHFVYCRHDVHERDARVRGVTAQMRDQKHQGRVLPGVDGQALEGKLLRELVM